MATASTLTVSATSHAMQERVREGLTMTLYIACSLLALLLLQPGAPGAEHPTPSLLFMTGAGLVAAHLLAFSVSTRMVSGGRLDVEALLLRSIQAAAGLGVSALTAFSLAATPDGAGALWTAGGLFALIGGSAYAAARSGGAPTWRAVVYVGIVWAVFAVVLLIKLAVPH